MAVQWYITSQVFLWFTVLCRGCSFGSMAILVSALWQYLSMLSGDGRRKAQALSKSIGEVHKPPMIAVAAACCNVVSCLVTLADCHGQVTMSFSHSSSGVSDRGKSQIGRQVDNPIRKLA